MNNAMALPVFKSFSVISVTPSSKNEDISHMLPYFNVGPIQTGVMCGQFRQELTCVCVQLLNSVFKASSGSSCGSLLHFTALLRSHQGLHW